MPCRTCAPSGLLLDHGPTGSWLERRRLAVVRSKQLPVININARCGGAALNFPFADNPFRIPENTLPRFRPRSSRRSRSISTMLENGHESEDLDCALPERLAHHGCR